MNSLRALLLSEDARRFVESLTHLEDITGGDAFKRMNAQFSVLNGTGPVTLEPDQVLELLSQLGRALAVYGEQLRERAAAGEGSLG